MSYKNISLSRPGIYVPPRTHVDPQKDPNVITNQDLEKMVDTNDEWITRRTGIKERRIEHYLGVHEMGAKAAEAVLKVKGYDGKDIDEIIFCTNKHHLGQEFKHHAGYVGEVINVRDGIPMHDEAAGCPSALYGIRAARNNLIAEKDKNKILVVAAEKLTSFTNYKDRSMCVLFGDAAGAYILERSKNPGILEIVTHGKPDRKKVLGLKRGMGFQIKPSDDFSLGKFKFEEKEDNYIYMDGQEVMKFASEAMSEAVHEVVEKAGYALKDVEVIVPHQANLRIINSARKNLKKKGSKGEIIVNIEEYGNTSGASTILAHHEGLERKIIRPGMLVVKVTFGAGLNWAAMLFKQE